MRCSTTSTRHLALNIVRPTSVIAKEELVELEVRDQSRRRLTLSPSQMRSDERDPDERDLMHGVESDSERRGAERRGAEAEASARRTSEGWY
mmetsp:Transcript_16254/g.32687  ORF Transcript_16254/g.32687 Transcript_16254/m.32687 type:complete len:92 (+) Transcript_16254:2737-3012(+)